ncbi:MAG: peptidase, partial [Pirellulaceae bacterium]|nr:peptidase [Pirellulaceae bacterium]
MLAGPQLIGVQPNEGALIENGTQRDTAPRVLTFGFDEAQVIDTATIQDGNGIRITRAGEDDVFNTTDDVVINPGLVTLGETDQNEVVVRFVEALPDDKYRIEVFGYDDDGQGIVGLKNIDGEFFVPSDPDQRSEVIDFELKLGALVESVVPQPVIRQADGSLAQNRNEIVVYFNEDPLFVEDDATGNPTARSAENPRFYQLLFTQETVRTTDDFLFNPDEVVYDSATHTARLFFSDDINDLPGIPPGGGSWRLRIGTAVDDRVDLILPPDDVLVRASAVTDFQQDGLRVSFFNLAIGEGTSGRTVRFVDSGAGGVTASLDGNNDVVFDFGGATAEVTDLVDAVADNPAVAALIGVSFSLDGVANTGGDRIVPASVVGSPALTMSAVGDTLGTALDVGVFGEFNALKSQVFRESISPQQYDIELPGGQDDPGHTSEVQHINAAFGADTLNGVTEIAYNFKRFFDTDTFGNSFQNQITARQKTRIREALGLWAAEIGVQFRETQQDGITFALGDTANLQDRVGIPATNVFQLDASVRVDPAFAESALVFSNQEVFGTAYGEDFTRKAVAGIGLLLGLNQAADLSPPTIMSFNTGYLERTIDGLSDLEPVFPNNVDVLHGQYVHRPDSNDIDLYRFEVDLNDADKQGLLTAETFAERLADSSLLDTTLTLFQEVSASVTTNLGIGTNLEIEIESLVPGLNGNNSRLEFIQTDRVPFDTAVKILPAFDSTGTQVSNAVIVDVPRLGPNVTTVTAGMVVDAINDNPFSSSIFRAAITTGNAGMDISGGGLSYSPLLLDGGGLQQLSRNDDYFGEDSRLIASLGEGVYYLGVAASGNDQYDPTIADSGVGGRTQGLYELHLKFEPQVDEVDVIRDLDNDRVDVPGTALDGDGDGVPGGAHNFWFQTRPLSRIINFTDSGDAITAGQTVTIVGASGVTRTFEFVPTGGSPRPGNIAVTYSPGGTGFPTPPGNLASSLQAAINARIGETGVSVVRSGTTLEFSGERSMNFSTGFRGADALGRNIFVDKTAGPQADGSLARPFNNITNANVANAFGSAIEGDIVRIVGNGGLDNDIRTEADNFSYKIGVADTGGVTLEDGRNMEVPKGVTTMIDAGAVFKLRNSFIGIGSSTVNVDRSGGALQVLGTPRLIQLSVAGQAVATTLISGENVAAPGYDDGSVIFTSLRDRDADVQAAGNSVQAAPGNWGGLIYRRDIDQSEGRRDLEDEGIFLQRVNHAELRYGGGSGVLIDSVQQLVNPIQIVNMRPTVSFNEITQSADSAISAAPNSFEETSYQAPRFQQAGSFTADYDRVGPEIHNNQLIDNSINGLFIRATTTPTTAPKDFTVAGRFDDIDVVHYVAENLVVSASPGGSIADGFAPSMSLVSGRVLAGGTLPVATYQYKMTFVDRDGFESLASPGTFDIVVGAADSSVELTSLPQVASDSVYVSRRLYRAVASATPQFTLVADLDASSAGFIDRGTSGDSILDLNRAGVRGRLDASLVMDPGLIMKFRGARIELGQGTQLLAEGLGSNPVVFTSSLDDRFGAGGTFDTNNDNETITGAAVPQRADWSGIYAGPTSFVSFDNVQLSYAGGISLLEGGLARGFLPLELQQAEGRITNSRFEFNDAGQAGAGPQGRFGRLAITPATIMVRGSQPIIVGNTFVDNRGSIIDIDIESMGGNYRVDYGRQTGDIDRIAVLDDNFGPMIRFNRYLNDPTSGSQLSGLEVRAGTITTETVFDDTDIAHLVFDNIEVGNFHSSGGLRLLSRPDESLVVKFTGSGGPNSATQGTGITATGSPSSIDDRIGGMVHVIGLPGAPVILTSLDDDGAGAGLKPDGSQFTDHDGDGINSRPFANDWRGILLDQYSNDYNIPVLPELELSTEVAPGLNSTVENAQFLGELAQNLSTGDHVRRLGFEVQGYLSGKTDVDVYSFIGSPGTEVWVDVDRTSFGLDTVVELLDENGQVLARSDNSFAETAFGSPEPVTILDPDLEGVTTSLQAGNEQYTDRGVFGLYEDFGSTNIRDAGIHFRLAGNASDPNARSVYFFRIRSASVNPDDAQGGITGGGYRFQARLVEEQEFPGSVVRFADIRYANHGIHVQGLMSSSPLLGEAQENEAADFRANNNTPVGTTPGQGGQYLGNLVNNNSNVISVGGSLGSAGDVDFYQFEIDYSIGGGIQSTVFDIDYADGFNRPDTNISVFYDGDGLPVFGDDGSFLPRLVFFGSSSNVTDDMTSPNGEDSAIEKLLRGSISNGDPFIGPVALPEGVYYVAVSSAGVTPAELVGNIREPINSVDRIVEDRIDRNNPETPSTANGPVVPQIFTDASLVGSGFTIDSDTTVGHGKPDHFDGTTGPSFFNGAPRIPELTIAGGFDAEDDILTAIPFTTNLDSVDWSLDDDFDIGGFGSEFTATTIPHISVVGNLQNDPADFYQFTIPNTGSNLSKRVIFDIDDGYNMLADFDDDGDPLTPPVNFDQNSVDTTLVILREDPANPGTLQLLQTVTDDFTSTNGASGSNSALDPFLSTFLAPGNYFVGVLEEGTTLTFDANGVTSANAAVTGGQQGYTLHVSIEDHVLPPNSFVLSQGEEVLEFDRQQNTNSGIITSESFDLAGYVAADLPTLYFNRLFQPVPGGGGTPSDTATLTVLSDQNPSGTLLHTFSSDTTPGSPDQWKQIRLSLGSFAGNTGVQLRIEYTTNGQVADSSPGSTEVGLRLDDFIVGFAERGETIFGAASNPSFVGTGFGAVSGEYQAEIRLGTDFATAVGGGNTRLDASFDTNDRHARAVTMVAPDGMQISNGDTFVIGDGASNQVFEFTTNGSVTFGNTPVPFVATDTPSDIAASIRNAINSQTVIAIEAATSGGLDTGTPTDGRLALSGNTTGSFDPIASIQAAPGAGAALATDADGNLLIPAILHDGRGDGNFLRTQGQVIVEHNVISDVRGIGIWSEPGTRDVSPAHNLTDPYLEAVTLGNSYPGAVRNLPTLNTSVLGGLAPGIVIQNNTIDQAEYAGIKIDGEIAPWAIAPPSGDFITDGSIFVIDAAGTRVVFEFEDIGEGAIPAPQQPVYGSGTDGGDGVRDGHVPVYYRQTDQNAASPYRGRTTEYTALEVASSIRASIQGSILMSNNMVELVEAHLGPSLIDPALGFGVDFLQPAVYIPGASFVHVFDAEVQVFQTPIYEAPQPFARIVNNTIYGNDGTESNFVQNAQSEPSDFLSQAIDTNVGSSHRDPYRQTATLGNNTGPLAGAGDVDFYQVHLEVGDRLIADIDTLNANVGAGIPEGPDTVLRIFNSSGIVQSFQDANDVTQTISDNAIAPNYLDPQSNASAGTGTGADANNTRDPFIDFTAPKTGTYYVGVSSAGNNDYDASSLSGRVLGTGGTGDYTIGLEVYAPRSFVISGNNGSGLLENPPNHGAESDRTGMRGSDVIGTTFTITQIPDVDDALPQSDGTNEIEFLFDPGPYRVLGTGQVTVSVQPAYRLPDIMVAIETALTLIVNGRAVIPNGGAITPGDAAAVGGPSGAGQGIVDNPLLYAPDFNTSGFGHSMFIGSTEQYVFVEKIAEIELSTGAAAAGLKLDPLPNRDTDQPINEAGVVVAGGASPTLLNNVFLNLHESVYREETRFDGFGTTSRGSDQQPKPMEVIVVASIFQHDETNMTQFNQDMVQFANRGTGLTTSAAPSNINGGSDDFNVTLGGGDPAVQFAEGGNFQPDFASILIDSSVNSLVERDALVNLKNSVGLPISNVLAPDLDVAGILRADNPDFAPPGGIGASVFKDRGSNELADFVGPVAIAEVPRDNDAEGIDSDPAVSFINLTRGVYEEFRVQLRDTGDASDPFAGIGIDDATVVVPEIPGVRPTGSNVSLFENERLLVEGINYTFNYDETKNIITLTPLAGIWKSDRAYRIALNNQDQTVLIASDPAGIQDGSQFAITDTNGGTVVFEFETGYQLLVPEPITLIIPREGTNSGGVRDGDIFQIDDGVNPIVVFEYNSDTAKLPNTVAVPLPNTPTPLDPDAIDPFLNQIALDTQAAIQAQVDAGNLNLDLDVVDNRVIIGAEPGTTARTSGSGLLQAARTIGLDVPAAGSDPINGVRNGETFVVSNGVTSITFEFNDASAAVTPGNTPVDISGVGTLTTNEVAIAIVQAVSASPLGIDPQIIGSTVYLNLPTSGSASVTGGQLTVVGVSRTPTDGDTVVVTPDDGTASLVFEVNRTDEPDALGVPMDDGVAPGNIAINIDRLTTADEFAALVANAIQSEVISGLSPNDIQVVSGGLLTIGGEQGLGLAVTGTSLEVVGAPDVTGASTIQVFGPLLLNMPPVGGGSITSGEVLILRDDFGSDVLFEFVNNQGGAQFFDGGFNQDGTQRPVSVVVAYNSFDDPNTIATTLAGIINAQGIGLTAVSTGTGQVALGRIDASRVNTGGDLANGIPGISQITVQRGIVSDGEVLTIRQGTTQVSFEFEEATTGGGVNTPGNIAVAFQAGSTVGDVANSLAAAINNNAGNLRVFAVAELDSLGVPTGQVILNDIPGTVVDVTQAPTLNVIGVPGGAIPVRISPAFSATEVKQAMLIALNSINTPGQPPATTLSAQDRGGATLFVQNGTIFTGEGITTYFLPAIKDLSGNKLEANRDDLTTQFTILMPTVGLDFGDAPDPVAQVQGRYPTLLRHDGPRHVVDPTLTLGSFIDVDLNGRPVAQANGDDNVISISDVGDLFTTSVDQGVASILINAAAIEGSDGQTITINTGVDIATLEVDLDGIFDEDNFAIRPLTPRTVATVAQAIVDAIAESPLRPASVSIDGDTVRVNSDDEDGVDLTSFINPTGVLNKNVQTPISVTVTGGGVLEAWVDFNADGDWDDPGEQIIDVTTPGAIFSDTGSGVQRVFTITVPATTPVPPAPLTTYARFRVSREGDLDPTGLALSGEIEDYAMLVLPGAPPTLTDAQANRTFTVREAPDSLAALDVDGTLSPETTNDNGLLEGVADPQGDGVEIYPDDVGVRTLFADSDPTVVAGVLTLAKEGTFTFIPEEDFNGTTSFTARVTDTQPFNPASQLVNNRPITATIVVTPINDPPFTLSQDVVVSREIDEDIVQIFTAAELIDPFYQPGPANESDQPLIIQSVSSAVNGNGMSNEGGVVEIINGGTAVRYTPKLDFNGSVDTFTYIVADVPPSGQLVRSAAVPGTVSITVNAVNDDPRARDDAFPSTQENTPLSIPINGIDINNPGILDNDTAGPDDEIATQTIELKDPAVQFGTVNGVPVKTSFQGGTIQFINGALQYDPPPGFSGTDSFSYTIVDSNDPPGEAVGTVLINVGGVNDVPAFIGINGDSARQSLSFDESKETPQQFVFNLATWFRDPEGDVLTFSVSSGNPSIVTASEENGILTLVLPSFRFGTTNLFIDVSDGNGGDITTRVPITVVNGQDPPQRDRSLDPLTGVEDQNVIVDLRSVFSDPDGDRLDYKVVAIDGLINPTDAQIAQHPLIQSIAFVGDDMIITPDANQSGSVEIEISAEDDLSEVRDTFTLTITPVADAPIARGDAYNVPVGALLQISNPADGLLRNDTDADGNPITVELPLSTTTQFGTLNVASDGTFTYQNNTGSVGTVDSFRYRTIDSTGLRSAEVVVSLTLNQSRYQNPIKDLEGDVTADGVISPVDVLRVINFLSLNGTTPV